MRLIGQGIALACVRAYVDGDMSLTDLSKAPGKPSRKPDRLHDLSDRHHAIIAALVDGDETGKAMSIPDVSKLLRVRQRHIRWLMADPLFRAAYAGAIAVKRMAVAPRAIERITELVESTTEMVALSASKAILGDDAKAPAVQVNVQTNVQANVRAGYRFEPCDRPAATKLIDGTAD